MRHRLDHVYDAGSKLQTSKGLVLLTGHPDVHANMEVPYDCVNEITSTTASFALSLCPTFSLTELFWALLKLQHILKSPSIK